MGKAAVAIDKTVADHPDSAAKDLSVAVSLPERLEETPEHVDLNVTNNSMLVMAEDTAAGAVKERAHSISAGFTFVVALLFMVPGGAAFYRCYKDKTYESVYMRVLRKYREEQAGARDYE